MPKQPFYAVLFVLFSISAVANAQIVVVDSANDYPDANLSDGFCDDGTGCCTLRAAIEQASSGWTIQLPRPGSGTACTPTASAYYLNLPVSGEEDNPAVGDLDINVNLTIEGLGTSRTQVRIDASNIGGRVFHVHDVDVTFSNLRIQSGLEVLHPTGVRFDYGGAVLIDGSSLTRFDNVFVYRSQANLGGGAIALGRPGYSSPSAQLEIRNSLIAAGRLDGTGTGRGGGIYLHQGTGYLEDTDVEDNDILQAGSDGGGIATSMVPGSAILTISGGSFYRNTTTGFGGAIFASGADLTLVGTEISSNQAAFGGGLYRTVSVAAGVYSTLVDASYVAHNQAQYDGGGFFIDTQRLSTDLIVDSEFRSNVANLGGAGFVTGTNVTLLSSALTSNEARFGGGGLYVDSTSDATLLYVTAASNQSDRNGGAISNFGTLGVFYSEFDLNTAVDLGGAIHAGSGDTAVVDTNVLYGQADQGGGLYAESNAFVELVSATFAFNEAYTHGGGVYLGGTSELVQSTFSQNWAAGSGGGVLVPNGANALIFHSTITQNDAYFGGGIYAFGNVGPAAVVLHNSILAGNSASGHQHHDCMGIGPFAFITMGNNIVGDIYGCTFPTMATDSFGDSHLAGVLDPILGPLADNGGWSLTHLIDDESPAVNHGPSWGCGGPGGTLILRDQRNEPRPAFPSTLCDTGSVESPVY